jgi:hypothetical protein
MSIAINVFVIIGAITVFVLVVWPIFWACMYATGKLIFDIRVATADGRRLPLRALRRIPALWFIGFGECISGYGAEKITCGKLQWIPPFKYKGFGGDK